MTFKKRIYAAVCVNTLGLLVVPGTWLGRGLPNGTVTKITDFPAAGPRGRTRAAGKIFRFPFGPFILGPSATRRTHGGHPPPLSYNCCKNRNVTTRPVAMFSYNSRNPHFHRRSVLAGSALQVVGGRWGTEISCFRLLI